MKPFAFSPAVDRLIDMALEEDIGPGDITTDHTVPSEASGQAVIVAKEDLVICGLGQERPFNEGVVPIDKDDVGVQPPGLPGQAECGHHARIPGP